MTPSYRYRILVTRVIDGDTLVADVDLGFKTWLRGVRLRLAGINCPEMTTPEGLAAFQFTSDHIFGTEPPFQPTRCVADVLGVDKYARWDAVVYVGDASLNDLLVSSGHAVRVARGEQAE